MDRLSTDNKIERQQILRFTDQEYVDLEFEQAFFFFTDATYEEISSVAKIVPVSIPDSVEDIVGLFREKIRSRFPWNFDARLLADLSTGEEGHFFSAFLECLDDEELLYLIDPMDEEIIEERLRGLGYL